MRFFAAFLCVVLLSACNLTPTPVPAQPLCNDGQVSTVAEPCTAKPNTGGDTGGSDTGAEPATPSDPGATPTLSCKDVTVKPRSQATLSAQTTMQSCYEPGSSNAVYMSVKLLDDTVTFVKPTFVFDIVRVNANGSTTSVAYQLLGKNRPSASPDIFQSAIMKEQLLEGLETSVAFKFDANAAEGKYVMVISLFKDSDARKPANLVGRIFYDFEIKVTP